MAGGREHTDEDRYELVSEARELAQVATTSDSPEFEPSGQSPDALLAALASRAGVDSISPSGRMRGVKRGVLKASQVFLRDQTLFNRLLITALEDLTARLDAVEARLAAFETKNEASGLRGD